MRLHFQSGQQGEENQDGKRCDQRRDPPDPGGIINLRPTHTSPLAAAWDCYKRRLSGRSISRRHTFVKKWNYAMGGSNPRIKDFGNLCSNLSAQQANAHATGNQHQYGGRFQGANWRRREWWRRCWRTVRRRHRARWYSRRRWCTADGEKRRDDWDEDGSWR